MKKILIIGGCGYIGSALFLYLKKKECVIDTVDLEWFGNYVNRRNIKKDYNSLSKSFFKKYDVIILLAGYSSVQMCSNKMQESFTENVVNFINLMTKLKNQKFIYASSSSVYGNTKDLIVNENFDRYSPTNFYDLSKREIDYYAGLSRLNYFGLRFGTVNGFSPNFRRDLMINKMFLYATKKKKIALYNTKFFRPILGINDLCRAIESIIEKNCKPGIYNIASFNKTIKSIGTGVAKQIIGAKIEINDSPGTSSYNFSISTKKFEKEFNFKFTDTVETIVDSLSANYNNILKTAKDRL